MVRLLFFPNLNLLCSNGEWLALFCAGSFSRDWKPINLIGWRLIWLISTLLEYELGPAGLDGIYKSGITGYDHVIATHCLSDEIRLGRALVAYRWALWRVFLKRKPMDTDSPTFKHKFNLSFDPLIHILGWGLEFDVDRGSTCSIQIGSQEGDFGRKNQCSGHWQPHLSTQIQFKFWPYDRHSLLLRWD